MIVWNKTSDLLPETHERVYNDDTEEIIIQESNPMLIHLADGEEDIIPYDFAYYEIDGPDHIYWVTVDGWSYEPNQVIAWADLEELK